MTAVAPSVEATLNVSGGSETRRATTSAGARPSRVVSLKAVSTATPPRPAFVGTRFATRGCGRQRQAGPGGGIGRRRGGWVGGSLRGGCPGRVSGGGWERRRGRRGRDGGGGGRAGRDQRGDREERGKGAGDPTCGGASRGSGGNGTPCGDAVHLGAPCRRGNQVRSRSGHMTLRGWCALPAAASAAPRPRPVGRTCRTTGRRYHVPRAPSDQVPGPFAVSGRGVRVTAVEVGSET